MVRKGRPTKVTSDQSEAHIAKIRQAEQLVDQVELGRERLRDSARAAIGVTGSAGAPPLREAIRKTGTGWYTLLVLGILVVVDEFQGFALLVLGPEISDALGISKTTLGGLVALKIVAVSLATLPMAAYVQRGRRRAAVAIFCAMGWSLTTLSTGFVAGVGALTAVLLLDGVSSGSVRVVHGPLLVDSYPPDIRVRLLSFYRGALEGASILAPLSVAALITIFDLTWRGIFLAIGVLSLGAALFAIRLRDPGYGKWDTSRVREAVRGKVGQGGETVVKEDPVSLRFFEIVRRLMLIPTVRRVFIANAVFGMMLVPLNTYLFFFLEERWGLGPGERGVLFAALAVPTIIALAIFGPRGENLFRKDPSKVVRAASLLLGAGVVTLAFAMFAPKFALMVILLSLSFVLLSVLGPALSMSLLSIIRPQMRPHASAMSGIFLAAVGGFGGLILLGGLDVRFGSAGAIASLAIPGIVAALVLSSASKTINTDLDRMLDDIVEEEELRVMEESNAHLPLLHCRNIDFSYGQIQVLFGVTFSVDEGELVALLGTNGAGKSTLLRVISGLGLPTRGSVRLRGSDITFLDAERRVDLGILQIPGGRAIFPPLSVLENLRLYAFTHGRNTRAINRAIDESFEAFPRLAERRNQLAATLSGGEQQMLALARAFVIKPRLLLIDELSLGLSPKIVAELLEVVRRINSTGTAIVLVEQSVNLALSIAKHAYFMEKGEIRFDGTAEDLLTRGDLLRSVFLEGASHVLEKK